MINVLARLNAEPAPQNAADDAAGQPTRRWPNTARYDSLRAQDDAEEIDHA